MKVIVSLKVLKREDVSVLGRPVAVGQLDTRPLSSQLRKRSNSPFCRLASSGRARASRAAVPASPAAVTAPRASLARRGGGAAGAASRDTHWRAWEGQTKWRETEGGPLIPLTLSPDLSCQAQVFRDTQYLNSLYGSAMSRDGCSGHAKLPGSRNTPSRLRE